MKESDTRLQLLLGDNGLPILKSPAGLSFQLTERDLETITDLAATGHSPDFIAMRLGVSVKTFERARAQCDRIQHAIRAGISKDDADITKAIRESAMEGSMIAAIHYSKHKLKWVSGEAEQRNDAKGKTGTIHITVNTGIDRGEAKDVTPTQVTVTYDNDIEEENHESLF